MKPEPNILYEKIKKCLDRAIEDIESRQGISHEIVMTETKKRYPKYFKD